MALATLLKLALVLSVFVSVFALALQARLADVLLLVHNWRQGLRATVAIYMVVPAAAITMCHFFQFRPAVEIAMIAIAFSPIPPILPKKQLQAGGSASYVTGLLVLASALSLVITPLGIALSAKILNANASIDADKIALTLFITIGAPLGCGLLFGYVLGPHAHRAAGLFKTVGGIMLAVSVLLWVWLSLPAMWAVIGDGTLVALIAMCAAALVAGSLLGGPDPGDRAALSLAAAARHPGVAIAIATSNFPDERLAPAAVLLSLILYTVISIPYLRLIGRNAASGSADPVAVQRP